MVTPRFAPLQGGVETHVLEVGRRLVRDHGVGLRVLTTDADGTLGRSDAADGIAVERVPAGPRGSDVYWAPDIARRVRDADVDLVHVQGYHTLVPPLAMIGARRANLPYLVTFHSGGHSSRLRRLVRPAQLVLLRPLLRAAARLVAVSEFEAGVFARAGLDPRRIVTIPNGADLPPGADPGPMPRDGGLILSIGRLERYKGHHRLVDALPLIRDRVPDARLLVLGSGPQGPELARLARARGVADRVEVRSVPRGELPTLLRRAGAVAFLSDYESQGIAAYEALALGAPIVVVDATALAELARKPGVRAIRPDAAADEVADAVVEQLRLGPPSQATPLPTWDECAAALARLYTEVLDRRRARSAWSG